VAGVYFMKIYSNRKYDIVIPVFNGLHFFRECYGSVRQYTPDGHTILIIDDASTEPELLTFLEEIGRHPNTEVLRRPENMGFVHSANVGMAHSSNHVILLNSDTVVTPSWLDKLDRALFHAPNIATVTPWTNKGTICSLPRFCEDNELPVNVTAAAISHMAETLCPGRYTPIPTAVGFCMAIRRQVLDEISFFDSSTFGRGYGEENDFCMRAWLQGYENIHDDRTFIFHQGSVIMDIFIAL